MAETADFFLAEPHNAWAFPIGYVGKNGETGQGYTVIGHSAPFRVRGRGKAVKVFIRKHA